MAEINEALYRKTIQETLDTIQGAFENVDPDIAECEQALGSMTLTFADRSRCILSAQPSVKQLWLAVASRGTAYHFNWDATTKRWMDDKGKGIELLSFLRTFLKEQTGQEIALN